MALVKRENRDPRGEHAEGRGDQHRSDEEAHQRMGRPLLDVGPITPVIPEETVPRRAELEGDRGDQDQAYQLVQREQRVEKEIVTPSIASRTSSTTAVAAVKRSFPPYASHADQGKRPKMSE